MFLGMALFKKKKNKASGGYFLVLDVGSSDVKALVCQSEGKKVEILGSAKKKQELGDMDGGMITDIGAVINNCHAAIRAAEKAAGVMAEKMILGISGELVKGATHTTSYVRRDASKKIDLAEFKNVVHKIQWRAFEVIRSQIARESGHNELDFKLVNAAIEDVRVDDYKIKNPIGFQGKEVTLSVFNAFSPLENYGALQTIAAEIDRELLVIAAEPYVLAKAMAEENGNQFNGIFIDVGAATTDIAIVKEGAVVGTKMFSIGGNMFTKRLSQTLNISFKEAESVKHTYSDDKLERQSHRIVREALQNDCEIWLSGVILSLDSFDKIKKLPSKIYLSGGGAILPEIKEILETREWVKSLPFSKKPQISFMSPKMFSNVLDEEKVLKDHQDVVPAALANSGLSYVGEEPLPSKVLKKVVRLMQI